MLILSNFLSLSIYLIHWSILIRVSLKSHGAFIDVPPWPAELFSSSSNGMPLSSRPQPSYIHHLALIGHALCVLSVHWNMSEIISHKKPNVSASFRAHPSFRRQLTKIIMNFFQCIFLDWFLFFLVHKKKEKNCNGNNRWLRKLFNSKEFLEVYCFSNWKSL